MNRNPERTSTQLAHQNNSNVSPQRAYEDTNSEGSPKDYTKPCFIPIISGLNAGHWQLVTGDW
jgi:hypothetical protein